MLTKISDDKWIDLDDVYLACHDEFRNSEFYVYLKMHPKIPIVLNKPEEIAEFKQKLSLKYGEMKNGEILSKDEQSAG